MSQLFSGLICKTGLYDFNINGGQTGDFPILQLPKICRVFYFTFTVKKIVQSAGTTINFYLDNIGQDVSDTVDPTLLAVNVVFTCFPVVDLFATPAQITNGSTLQMHNDFGNITSGQIQCDIFFIPLDT